MPPADLRVRFRTFVETHALLEPGERVVVGVSGGVDSVVLLALLRDDFRPHVVHVHHGLRPEADDDAAFVEGLARGWGVPVEVHRVRIPSQRNVQAAARRARYAALAEAARAAAVRSVAVAHHRDDVAETLLLQLLRGAGPAGWAALPLTRRLDAGVCLVRPLRFAHRAEIEAFARAEGLPWREDATNASTRYRRGIVRHAVLPLLEAHFGPGAAARLARAAELAEAYRRTGAPLGSGVALARVRVAEGALDARALAELPEPLRFGVWLEALARWLPEAPRTEALARQLDALLDRQPGRRVETPAGTVWRERDTVRFVPPPATGDRAAPRVDFLPAPAPIGGGVRIEPADPRAAYDPALRNDPRVEIVDADVLRGPLALRPWRPGDRIAPLGLGGRHKKVSDLLTERRVPPSERARQLVLTAGPAVVWVVGHRLAEHARIGPSTRRALRLTWEPAAPPAPR